MTTHPRTRALGLAAGVGLAAASYVSSAARADDLPAAAGTGVAQATKGATDVTGDKFQTADRAAAEAKDATELALSAGTLASTGNSRSQAATAAAKFRVRRGSDQLKLAAAGNYAAAKPVGASEYTTTLQNFQGLERFDRFLGDVTLFVSAQERNDKFQGLRLRTQVDPGAGYYFVNQKTKLLWIEVGYDLTYDLRTEAAKDANGGEGTNTLHSSRTFVGHENALTETSKLTLGVEFLQGLSDSGVRRLVADAAVTAKIVGNLSIGASFSDRYDSKPLGPEKNDVLVAASLVYTVL